MTQRAATGPERTSALPADSHTIRFPPRVTTVDQIGKEKLRQHAEYLKQDPKRTIVLSGHTDDLGSRSYNLIIAEERIAAVSKLLRAYGVPNRQIQRKSVRKDKSPASCISMDCRQKMRRVELLYLP
jgi:outer membrane protein OmpA-like peptidoglycan-associated protein